MRAAAYSLILWLTGCASLPEPDPARGDCQLRAGAATGEGSYTGLFSAQSAGGGGAVTMIGDCPDDLRVLTRTREGSLVCHGFTAEQCLDALDKMPVEVTPETLRTLVAPE